MDKPSRRYDLKYASYDALNTKKKYPHVQSKVKMYIDNLKKEDEERRKSRITRHRSEPSVLAEWNSPGIGAVKMLNESSTDNLKSLLEKKNQEVDELKSRLEEMKIYGDTINDLLNTERSRRLEFQRKLNAIRRRIQIVNSRTWSDPGFREGDRIAEDDGISGRGINTTDDIEIFIDNVFRNNRDWPGRVGGSEEEIREENDETILLQTVEVKPVKKGMKYRVKKILRCCTPCIKSEVV